MAGTPQVVLPDGAETDWNVNGHAASAAAPSGEEFNWNLIVAEEMRGQIYPGTLGTAAERPTSGQMWPRGI